MIYFKKNGNNIEKYDVTYDTETLIGLKNRIINDCSEITHHEYESDYEPSFNNDEVVANYSYKFVGYKEYFEETRSVYLYSYDMLEVPKLVKYINNLLNGDSNALHKILKYDLTKEETIDNRIEELNHKLNNIPFEHILAKKNILLQLEKLIEHKKRNINQKPIDTYYQELISLLNFKLLDTLSLEELSKIESFLNIEIRVKKGKIVTENKEYNIEKVKKLQKKKN